VVSAGRYLPVSILELDKNSPYIRFSKFSSQTGVKNDIQSSHTHHVGPFHNYNKPLPYLAGGSFCSGTFHR